MTISLFLSVLFLVFSVSCLFIGKYGYENRPLYSGTAFSVSILFIFASILMQIPALITLSPLVAFFCSVIYGAVGTTLIRMLKNGPNISDWQEERRRQREIIEEMQAEIAERS